MGFTDGFFNVIRVMINSNFSKPRVFTSTARKIKFS